MSTGTVRDSGAISEPLGETYPAAKRMTHNFVGQVGSVGDSRSDGVRW